MNMIDVVIIQVRLRIVDGTGSKHTICKTVQVAQKQLKLTFSKVDSSIKTQIPNKESKTISSKCADIDATLCQILGVSKSILNNVIFCHQEESLWPLDESKKLKEKFDDIFDARIYNRCIDDLRKMAKQKAQRAANMNYEVMAAKTDRDIVEKKSRTLQEKKEKLDNFNQSITEKKELLKPIEKRLEKISEREENYSLLQSKYASKDAERKGKTAIHLFAC